MIRQREWMRCEHARFLQIVKTLAEKNERQIQQDGIRSRKHFLQRQLQPRTNNCDAYE
jgi:hypothetical protein